MKRLLVATSIAFEAICRTKKRSLLAVIGILIGAAAVMVVEALGAGVEARVATQVRNLGANSIFVSGRSNGASDTGKTSLGGGLTESDGKAIMRDAMSVASVVPFLSAQIHVTTGDRAVSTTVIGSTHGYIDVRGYSVARGITFTETDERTGSKVCLLGATVTKRLFGAQDVLGEIVRIGRHPFRVLGVLSEKGQAPSGEDQDDRIVIPANAFRARVIPTPAGRVHMLIASATDARTVRRAQTQIQAVLRQRHNIDDDHAIDFDISSHLDFARSQESTFGTLRALLIGIALVSFGVGGVGVQSNIMVSARERIREIGLRVAVGAREDDVALQFLVEAVVICVTGGGLGVVLGAAVVAVMAPALGWFIALPLSAIAVALMASLGAGILFGIWPARSASHTDPVAALHHP